MIETVIEDQNMQLTGKVNGLDLKDVQRMARQKSYWVKLFIRNSYAFLLLVAIAWITIAGLLGQTRPNWKAVGIIWAVIILIAIWSVYKVKRGQAKTLTQLNTVLSDQMVLANDGVKMDGPNGATRFLPWTNFKGWREGQRTILLDQTQANQFVILPIAQMSEIERQQLRSLLKSQIPSVNH